MARANYGRLGGRRSSTAIWQWTIMGTVVGLGCSAIFVLILLTVGVLNIDTDGLSTANEVTFTPVIVTATNDPNQLQNPTQTPWVVTATTDASVDNDDVEQAVVVAPTATDIPPSPDPASVVTETPEPTPTTQPQNTSGGITTQSQSTVPVLLQPLISDLIQIAGGSFPMGTSSQEVQLAVDECIQRDGGQCTAAFGQDSTPIHEVTLNPFFMEITEVSLSQYVAFLNSMGPSSHSDGCLGQPCIVTQSENQFSNILFDSANYTIAPVFGNLPAGGVTWYGASAYCAAIGRRLPTEAEWERAARGPNNLLYPWGPDWVDYAQVRIPAEGGEGDGATEVGTNPNNRSGFGVFDMAGNVAEWVNDYYSATYYQAGESLNPQGPSFGTTRVLRGGSWNTPPFFVRNVHRQDFPPDNNFLWMGFRCASDTNDAVTGTTGTTGTTGNIDVNTPVDTGDEDSSDINAAPTLRPIPTTVGEPTSIPDQPGG